MQLLKPYSCEPGQVSSLAQESKEISMSMTPPFFSSIVNEQNLKPHQITSG